MPWRLIGFILIIAILLVFIGFNLRNSCDISYGPGRHHNIPNVPVYMTILVSFFLGMLCSLPVLLFKRKLKKKLKKEDPSQTQLPGEDSVETSHKEPYGID